MVPQYTILQPCCFYPRSFNFTALPCLTTHLLLSILSRRTKMKHGKIRKKRNPSWGDLGGTSTRSVPECIKLKMYDSHIFFPKSVLVQLVKARVYYCQYCRYFILKTTQPNQLTKSPTVSTRVLCSR